VEVGVAASACVSGFFIRPYEVRENFPYIGSGVATVCECLYFNSLDQELRRYVKTSNCKLEQRQTTTFKSKRRAICEPTRRRSPTAVDFFGAQMDARRRGEPLRA